MSKGQVLKDAIENGKIKVNKKTFKKVCQYCDIDMVKLMIDKGANDWVIGLYSACKGGHMDIVKLIKNQLIIATECLILMGLLKCAKHSH